MEDYRSAHATPGQVDSLWAVIGSLRRQVEELTERLSRVEGEPKPAATASVKASSGTSSAG